MNNCATEQSVTKKQLVVSEEGSALLAALRRGLATGSRRPRAASPRPAAPAAAAASQAPPPAQQQQSTSQLVSQGDEWMEVTHRQTGLTYYWNQRTNETTALGEPRPGPEGRLAAYCRATVQPGQAPSRTAGLGQLVAMGAGVGLVFALLARLL